MSLIELDFTKHGIDEAADKLLIVNGVRYLTHALADEGGETFIFPLENIESGLINFIAKVYKFKPQAPELEQRQRTRNNPFILSLVGVPVAHEEHYEIPGGMMKFQRHETGSTFIGYHGVRGATPLPATPRAHADLEQRALGQLATYAMDGLADTLNSILALNQYHTNALRMKAELLLKNEQHEASNELVMEALRVDRNDVRLYHLAARNYVLLSQPERALEILDSALQRYDWEYESWELRREVATRFALWDVFDSIVADVERRLSDPSHLGANQQMRATISKGFLARRERGGQFYIESERANELTTCLKLMFEILSTDRSKNPDIQFYYGAEMVRIGRKWRGYWLGRVVAFIANSFFLFEPADAASMYGTPDEFMEALQVESAEIFYLRALGAIMRGQNDSALKYFAEARTNDPDDPYIQFGYIIGLRAEGNREQQLDIAITELRTTHSDHPVTALAAMIQ